MKTITAWFCAVVAVMVELFFYCVVILCVMLSFIPLGYCELRDRWHNRRTQACAFCRKRMSGPKGRDTSDSRVHYTGCCNECCDRMVGENTLR